MVDELLCIGAAHKDLSHVRDIEHSGLLTDRIVFIGDICVLDRHYETSERAHESAESHMLVI